MISQDMGTGVNLMNIRSLLFAILLGLSLPAAAEFQTVSLAHEVALSNFQVPASQNAGVIFRKCDNCDGRAVRVNVNTQYIINGQSVPLKEFRKRIFRIRNRTRETVTVLQHLESNTIVSVSVTI